MSRHADFETVYQKFLDQYGEEEGKSIYYDWLNKLGLDDTQPYDNQSQGLMESFSWLPYQVLMEMEGGKYWKVWAISEGLSMNENPYDENLDRAARSLENRAININHVPAYTFNYGVPDRATTARTVACEFEDGFVETVVWIGDDLVYPGDDEEYKGKTINQMLEDGDIFHPSIEALPRFPAPFEYDGDPSFTGMAFLTRNYLPGDPLTKIEPMFERMLLESRVKSRVKGDEKKVTNEPPQQVEYTSAPEEEEWSYDEEAYTPEQLSYASSVIVIGDVVHPSGYTGEDLTKANCYLPHHKPGTGDEHGGELVWSGVSAVGSALGDLDISDEAKEQARSHLAAHYTEFDKVPPWATPEWMKERPKERPRLKSETNRALVEQGDLEEPTVEQRLEWIEWDLIYIFDELWNLGDWIWDLEQRMWAKFESTQENTDTQFAAVNKRIDDAITLITGYTAEQLKEPFADYDDWDDCIAKNQDADDPEAYCAAIKRAVEERALEVCGTCNKYEEGVCTVDGVEKAEDHPCNTGGYALREQEEPETDVDKAKALFNLTDEEWDALTDEERQAYIDQLPPEEQVVFKCPECGAEFPTQAELDAHIAAEHPTTEESSPLVKELLERVKILEEARVEQVDDATRAKAQFDLSDEEWDALTDDEKQAYIDQLEPIVEYTCPECGAVFDTQDELDAHIAAEHPTAETLAAELKAAEESGTAKDEKIEELKASLKLMTARKESFEKAYDRKARRR